MSVGRTLNARIMIPVKKTDQATAHDRNSYCDRVIFRENEDLPPVSL
jgi:hypothetical protein